MRSVFEIPPARGVLGLLAIPILFLDFTLFISFPASKHFATLGILLDIIGAVTLAVPDISMFAQFFTIGRIQRARRTLTRGGVSYRMIRSPNFSPKSVFRGMAPTEGFEEVLNAVKLAQQHSTVHKSPNWEKIVLFRIFDTGSGGGPDLLCMNKHGKPVFTIDFPTIDAIMNGWIEHFSGRFRRTGLMLLVIGFIHQLLAQFV